LRTLSIVTGEYPRSPPLGSPNFPFVTRNYTQVLSFHTLAHSFALNKNSTLLFSIDCALFAQNNRGWGYPPSLQHPVPAPRRDVATCLDCSPSFPCSRPSLAIPVPIPSP
jgi:hypothetical protein